MEIRFPQLVEMPTSHTQAPKAQFSWIVTHDGVSFREMQLPLVTQAPVRHPRKLAGSKQDLDGTISLVCIGPWNK